MFDPFEEFRPEPWMDDSSCAQLPPEAADEFFPDGAGGAVPKAVKATCRRCPALTRCDDWIMRTERPSERYGYVAGMTPGDRERRARSAA